MGDRAMTLLASHPDNKTEMQYKLAQFYSKEDDERNPIYSEETLAILERSR